MALSAFGDDLDEEPVQTPGLAAAQTQTSPAQQRVTAFGDPLDEVPDQPEPAPAIGRRGMPPLPTDNGPTGLGDVGRSAVRGAVGLSESLVGLADLLSGGAAGNFLHDQFGYDPKSARQQINAKDTPERQASRQALEQAQGFGGTLGALTENPGNIPHAIVESVPSMLAGGVAGRGIAIGAKALGAAPGMAGILGAGAGEGLIAAGQQAEQTRQVSGDLTATQAGLALGSGALTGLLGAAGARIGRKLGVADIDAQMAGAGGADVAKGLVRRVLTGAGIESLEELTQSGQQQVLTNIATDRPVLEGVDKQMVLGGVVGGAMGTGASLRRPNMNAPVPIQQSAQQAQVAPPHQVIPTPIPTESAAPAAPQPVPFAKSADINPLLDNLNVQGAQRARTLELLQPVESSVELKRRGVLPITEQKRLASLIGLQGETANAFARKIGQAHNAEQIMAMTNSVSSRLKSVLEHQQKISSGQASDLDRANFVQQIADLRDNFGDLLGARAESGRALAAQRRTVSDFKQAQVILEGIGGIQGADDLATALGKAIQTGGIQNAAKLIAQPESKMQRLFGYYYRVALLSGVRTHAVNITSNSLTLGNEIIERGIAAGIGGTKRLATGGKSGQTVFAEPLDLLIGMSRGMSKAGAAAADAFRTGESVVLGGQAKQDNSLGLSNAPRKPGALNTAGFVADKAASIPYRALGAEDAWFATLNFEGELRTLARQQALAEKKLGQLPANTKLSQRIDQLVQAPTAKMIEQAGEHARTQTFNNKAGAFAQAVMSAKAKAPWLNLIVPFVRTPANIVKFGLQRTPAAPLFSSVRADLLAGGARQERAIARMLWGSGVMVGAGMLAQAGYITGAGPADKEEKKALLATGWRPYSIKVGDTYHEYNRLDPFSQWLGLAADMATMDFQSKGAGDVSANVLSSLVDNTINKTYMQGLSNFVEFLQDPKRNGEWYLRQMAGTMAQPFTLLSNIASEQDPHARETNSVLDQIKYRLPGLRLGLPEKLDQFGEPVPNRTYPGGALSIAAPISQSRQTDDPARLEAGRLGWAPGIPGKNITSGGRKHVLDDAQYHELTELIGMLTRKGAQRLIQSKGWASLDEDQRREALDHMVKKARAATRMAFLPYLTKGERAAIDKLRAAAEERI